MRRSEEEFSEVIWRGISPAVCMLVILRTRKDDLIWIVAEREFGDERQDSGAGMTEDLE